MSVAALIAVLEARGVDAATIVEAVKAVASAPVQSAGAKRQARYRERMSGNVTSDVTSDVTPLSPLPPPSQTQPPLNPPNPDGVAISPAPSVRAAALKAIEGACLEIVAGTEWPVTTAQDWHALTTIIVEHRLDPETELLPSIREQVARKRAKRETVRSWGYFVPGCLAFAAKAREPPAPMVETASPQNHRNGARNDTRNAQTPMQRALDALKPRGERPVGSSDGRTIDATYEASAH